MNRPRLLAGAIAGVGVLALSSTAGDASVPVFAASVRTVTASELGGTWHRGCPVGPAQLRDLHVSYVDFDGAVRTGSIVVATSVVPAVERVFRQLFAARFPIAMMTPESSFGGSDPRSMAADNTSGFNCRLAVANGPPQWSVHAYGEAIDVNPVENPYLFNGLADPIEGRPYLRRTPPRPGMAVPDGTVVRAFASVGWQWGGRWTDSPDYQHFSATGG